MSMNDLTQHEERFDCKTEQKILKALNKFSDYSKNPITEEQAIQKDKLFFIDPVNVCMIEALTDESKRILYKFVDVEESMVNYPESMIKDFKARNDFLMPSYYNPQYLKKIFDLLNIFEFPVKFYMSADYPTIIENKHFRIILAPMTIGDE